MMRFATLIALGGLLAVSQAHSEGFAVTKETPSNLPGYNVHRPTDMRGALPVIVWANGGCVRSDFTWSKLFERWAGEGFVVISITGRPGLSPEEAAKDRSTADHQAAAIDWAVKETRTQGSPYAGRLDVDRIAAAGNSCGGITSLTLASRDPRAKSVFVLSGSSVGPNQTKEAASPIMSKVSVPVMFVVGGNEDVARAAANMDYSLLPKGVGAMVVERNAFDHRTVSTDVGSLADAAEIGLNWFKATLRIDKDALTTLKTTICYRCNPETWTAKSKNLGAAQ